MRCADCFATAWQMSMQLPLLSVRCGCTVYAVGTHRDCAMRLNRDAFVMYTCDLRSGTGSGYSATGTAAAATTAAVVASTFTITFLPPPPRHQLQLYRCRRASAWRQPQRCRQSRESVVLLSPLPGLTTVRHRRADSCAAQPLS